MTTRDVTLTPDQLPGLMITLPGAGEFQVPVTATGPGGSVTKTIRVSVVQSNSPPTLTVRDAEGAPGEPIPLDITASDADSVTLTIPDGATLSTGTVVPPATESIQTMLDAAGMNGMVTIPAGTYLNQTILPLAGQTIQAEGVVMDGQGIVVRAISRGTVTGVNIAGLTVTNYNSPLQGDGGAIDGRGHTDWTLKNVNVVANAGEGVHLGAGWSLIGGLYTDNGTIAIGGGGGGTIILDGIECRNNSTTHPSLGFESGGMKIWKSTAIIRNSCIWGNWGPGIWFDGVGGGKHLVENNLIFDNKKGGVEIELQTGGDHALNEATIRNNRLIRNGLQDNWARGAGITLFNSNGYEVYGNYVEVGTNAFGDVGAGIFTIEQNRPVPTLNNDVHNNEIVFLVANMGRMGTVKDFDSGTDQFAVNKFHDNTIVRPNEDSGWYAWKSGWRKWNYVQANGGEVGSTFILDQRQPTQVACP